MERELDNTIAKLFRRIESNVEKGLALYRKMNQVISKIDRKILALEDKISEMLSESLEERGIGPDFVRSYILTLLRSGKLREKLCKGENEDVKRLIEKYSKLIEYRERLKNLQREIFGVRKGDFLDVDNMVGAIVNTIKRGIFGIEPLEVRFSSLEKEVEEIMKEV